MSKSDIITEFKRVYPEFYPSIIETTENAGIVETDFPDGTFYFIVTKNSVSASYNSLESARTQLYKWG